MKSSSFTPEWLQRRLSSLLPDYPDVNLCVALSGGLDSTALLAALTAHGRKRLRKRTRLRAIHVHHGLHANADDWTEHCSTLAARLNVPLNILRVKVPRPRGSSLEAVARDARYAALADALEPAEALLTAHHEDDQLETVFLQLMRGAGMPGLAAMPEVVPFAQGTLVRPLLSRSRAELEAWARANELTWVDDDTNANEQLDRNYLRRQVMPLIRARWPSAARTASRSSRHAAEAQRLLDALALADIERASNGPALSIQHLRALSPDRRRNAIRFWIARAGHPLPDTARLDEITGALLDARADANPHVEWSGTRLQRHADHLTLVEGGKGARSFERATSLGAGVALGRPTSHAPATSQTTRPKSNRSSSATSAKSEPITWNWRASRTSPSSGCWGTLTLEPDPHGPINLDALPSTLTVRQREGGERLRPARNGPTRTLKQLFQETRTPLPERANLPLLYTDERLIAVADRWLDQSIQATSDTPHRGRLRWHP